MRRHHGNPTLSATRREGPLSMSDDAQHLAVVARISDGEQGGRGLGGVAPSRRFGHEPPTPFEPVESVAVDRVHPV